MLSIIQKQNKWRPDVHYSTFAVDGISFDEWLSSFVDTKPFNPDDINNVKDLALSLDLYSEEEMQMVWYFLGHLQKGDSKLVPLLVCPDDVDLSCIVIVSEQVVTKDTVVWTRFGRDVGNILEQNPDDIEWFNNVSPLTFEKNNFIQVFNDLKKEIIQEHQEYGKETSIIFPADHERKPRLAKEDWELEIDSWYE